MNIEIVVIGESGKRVLSDSRIRIGQDPPCTVLTLRQIQYWRDGVSLFRHALDVTRQQLGRPCRPRSRYFPNSRRRRPNPRFQKSVAILLERCGAAAPRASGRERERERERKREREREGEREREREREREERPSLQYWIWRRVRTVQGGSCPMRMRESLKTRLPDSPITTISMSIAYPKAHNLCSVSRQCGPSSALNGRHAKPAQRPL